MGRVLAPHGLDVVGRLLQDLRPRGLLSLQRGHGVPEAGEAELDVVPPPPLQGVVVRPLIRVYDKQKKC